MNNNRNQYRKSVYHFERWGEGGEGGEELNGPRNLTFRLAFPVFLDFVSFYKDGVSTEVFIFYEGGFVCDDCGRRFVYVGVWVCGCVVDWTASVI